MNLITSNQNPLIKEIKALKVKKHREERREFFIEGLRFVEEALLAKAGILKVFVSSGFAAGESGKSLLVKLAGYEAYELPDKLFGEISDTESPQGILAVVKMKDYGFRDILSSKSFIVVLESIQDPGNMGTIIRTADAAGCSGIIITKGCVDLYNPKVLRSTMGSVFHVPVCFSADTGVTMGMVKSEGIRVYTSHLKGTRGLYETDLSGSVALVIGNEANGVSEEMSSYAVELIRIPMPGKAESLNASVAAGLLMYEAVRQRMQI